MVVVFRSPLRRVGFVHDPQQHKDAARHCFLPRKGQEIVGDLVVPQDGLAGGAEGCDGAGEPHALHLAPADLQVLDVEAV